MLNKLRTILQIRTLTFCICGTEKQSMYTDVIYMHNVQTGVEFSKPANTI